MIYLTVLVAHPAFPDDVNMFFVLRKCDDGWLIEVTAPGTNIDTPSGFGATFADAEANFFAKLGKKWKPFDTPEFLERWSVFQAAAYDLFRRNAPNNPKEPNEHKDEK